MYITEYVYPLITLCIFSHDLITLCCFLYPLITIYLSIYLDSRSKTPPKELPIHRLEALPKHFPQHLSGDAHLRRRMSR